MGDRLRSSATQFSLLRLLVVAVFVGVLGILTVVLSKASTSAVHTEAESGTHSSNAAIVTDSTASNGSAVRFGAGGAQIIRAVNDHPIWLSASQSTSWDLYVQAHIQAVRVDVPWDVMQPTAKHQWDAKRIGLLDNFVDAMHTRGILVTMIVLNAPTWANNSSDAKVPPVNDADYADYLQDLMTRYGSKVEAYEIWNEPNGGWAWTNPDPVSYTQLLKAAYTRARQVDATRTILGGSISGTDGQARSFLTAMYANGAKGYFDALSQHGYGDINRWYWPLPYPKAYSVIFGDWNTNMRQIMVANGDGNRPIWWTETGATTADTNGVSEQQQADMMTDAYASFKAHTIPQVQRLYWYSWLDDEPQVGGNATAVEGHYGIIKMNGNTVTQPTPTDFVPKPAFNVMAGE